MKKILNYFISLYDVLRQIRDICYQTQMLLHSIQSKIEEVEVKE